MRFIRTSATSCVERVFFCLFRVLYLRVPSLFILAVFVLSPPRWVFQPPVVYVRHRVPFYLCLFAVFPSVPHSQPFSFFFLVFVFWIIAFVSWILDLIFFSALLDLFACLDCLPCFDPRLSLYPVSLCVCWHFINIAELMLLCLWWLHWDPKKQKQNNPDPSVSGARSHSLFRFGVRIIEYGLFSTLDFFRSEITFFFFFFTVICVLAQLCVQRQRQRQCRASRRSTSAFLSLPARMLTYTGQRSH